MRRIRTLRPTVTSIALGRLVRPLAITRHRCVAGHGPASLQARDPANFLTNFKVAAQSAALVEVTWPNGCDGSNDRKYGTMHGVSALDRAVQQDRNDLSGRRNSAMDCLVSDGVLPLTPGSLKAHPWADALSRYLVLGCRIRRRAQHFWQESHL